MSKVVNWGCRKMFYIGAIGQHLRYKNGYIMQMPEKVGQSDVSNRNAAREIQLAGGSSMHPKVQS